MRRLIPSTGFIVGFALGAIVRNVIANNGGECVVSPWWLNVLYVMILLLLLYVLVSGFLHLRRLRRSIAGGEDA